MITAAAIVVGMHLSTAHFNMAPGVAMQDRNPGLYLRFSNGATGGAYRNSEGRVSAYAGWTFSSANGRWSITAGGVTGYRDERVGPLLVPSVRLGSAAGLSVRLSYLAKTRKDGAQGVHLSIERQL